MVEKNILAEGNNFYISNQDAQKKHMETIDPSELVNLHQISVRFLEIKPRLLLLQIAGVGGMGGSP